MHEHDKVYESGLLMSNPPQRRWICRTPSCLELGYERAGSSNGEVERKEWLEFERLLNERFKSRK